MSLKSDLIIIIISLLLITGCDRITDSNDSDDGLPPAAPASLSVGYSSDGIIYIEWIGSAEPDLAGFNIYRSIGDTSGFKKIYTTKNDYFYDDSLSYDSVYYYKVSAFDTQNRESGKTDAVSSVPINRYNPEVPRSPEINARNWIGNISIYLNWQSGSESDLAGYYIYRSNTDDFKPDTTNYVGLTTTTNFLDKSGLEFYKKYYYKIVAVDKGGLKSEPSIELTDMIFEVPEVIYPDDNSYIAYFENFIIKALKQPAHYKIILQTNEYFGEIWSREISTDTVSDSIAILFDAGYIYSDKKYYWRIITYSGYSSEPNSISKLYSFIIKP
jgi:hypothetical protein